VFHLLVSYSGWADHSGTIGSSRVYISPDNETDTHFLKNGRLDIAKVQSIPALLMTEIDGRGPESAKVAHITSVSQGARDTAIQYVIDTSVPTISNTAFQTLAAQAGLANLALSHTHWQIVDGDLFKLMLQNQHQNAMTPKVFSLGMRIPADAGHQFRSMPGQHSGPCRATVPVDAGRGGVTRVNRRYRGLFFLQEGELRWGKRGYPCARFGRSCGSRPRASATDR